MKTSQILHDNLTTPSLLINRPPLNNQQGSNVLITHLSHQQNLSHQHLTAQSYDISLFITHNILSQIFFNVQQKIFLNKSIRTKMTKYAGSFAHQYISQTVRMELDQNSMGLSFQNDFQPNHIPYDNLIPVGTNIQPNNYDKISKKSSVPQTTLGRFPRNSTMVTRSQKIILNRSQKNLNLPQPDTKNTTKTSIYIKLNQQDLPKYEISTDPFVEEIRKLKQAKLKQNQDNKKTQNNTRIRQIIKKDQKISYDFTGEIIKIKQNQKANFLSRSVQGQQNPFLSKKEKSPKIDQNPVNLDINTRKGYDKKALSKKGLEIEFSNIASLTPQLQIREGVKFIHNKAVMENKKKQPSINELKKTISTKRFTRNDFQRLKSLGDNKSVHSKGESPSLPSIIKSQTDVNQNSILERSMSQTKFEDKSRFRTNVKNSLIDKSQDKIFIDNEELNEMLLEPVHNSIEDNMILRAPQSVKQESNKMVALSYIDKANLNYIKTGTVGKVQLPKISYRIAPSQNLAQSQTVTLLQSKAKLKGKRKENQFERLRKHFQDKLRT